jgi:hypothetical protein
MRTLVYGVAAAGLLLALASQASALTVQSGPLPAAASVYIANQQEMGRRLNLGVYTGDGGAQPLPRHMAEAQVVSEDDGGRYAADPVAFMARDDAGGLARPAAVAAPRSGVVTPASPAAPTGRR